LQGSRVNTALERAQQLLQGQPEDSSRSILLITDGDFEEPGLESRVRELARSGIRLIVMGIGTEEGGKVPAADGGWLLDRGRNPIESSLREDLLRRLAEAGNGLYLGATFRDDDTDRLVELAMERSRAQEASDEQTRVWNERFYLLVLPLLLLLLPRYRVNPVRRRA
jgi:Ca-activated chloride channel family protein